METLIIDDLKRFPNTNGTLAKSFNTALSFLKMYKYDRVFLDGKLGASKTNLDILEYWAKYPHLHRPTYLILVSSDNELNRNAFFAARKLGYKLSKDVELSTKEMLDLEGIKVVVMERI